MSWQEDEIVELNSTVKVKIAPSPIHGVGVFAICDIRQGEKLYCRPNPKPKWYSISWSNLNKLFPEVRELVKQRWASIVNGSMFLSPNDDVWLILYMNHSDNPNYDEHKDEALHDILKGEEILSNYCRMDNAHIAFPNLCPKEKT